VCNSIVQGQNAKQKMLHLDCRVPQFNGVPLGVDDDLPSVAREELEHQVRALVDQLNYTIGCEIERGAPREAHELAFTVDNPIHVSERVSREQSRLNDVPASIAPSPTHGALVPARDPVVSLATRVDLEAVSLRPPLARLLSLAAILVASLGCVGVAAADAGVRAFSATTGAEDTAFVGLGSVTRPSALIPDGTHGLYIVGRLTVAGGARSIVHVLPDGTVDRSFHASIGPGAVFSGAARGNDLVLIGRFTRIDGGTRHNIAVLDARTGRLSSWAPAMPFGGVGGVVFTPTRLVASVGKAVVAWRVGKRAPVWTRSLPSNRAGIVYWHGEIVTSDAATSTRSTPRTAPPNSPPPW
jgi:hypothetical protein